MHRTVIVTENSDKGVEYVFCKMFKERESVVIKVLSKRL